MNLLQLARTYVFKQILPRRSMTLASACPECYSRIDFQDSPSICQSLRCSNCLTTLVVVELDPLRLDWAFEDPIESNQILNDDLVLDELIFKYSE